MLKKLIMELKVFFDDIEIELPLYQEENNLDIMLGMLNNDIGKLVDNIKVLEYFGITFSNGK
jgi:hypothetical protein